MNNSQPLLSETTSIVERRPPPRQVAVVLMSLVVGILLMGIQVWLLTVALDLYLAGRGGHLWLIGVISGIVFLGGLLILRLLSRHPHVPTRRPAIKGLHQTVRRIREDG